MDEPAPLLYFPRLWGALVEPPWNARRRRARALYREYVAILDAGGGEASTAGVGLSAGFFPLWDVEGFARAGSSRGVSHGLKTPLSDPYVTEPLRARGVHLHPKAVTSSHINLRP